MELGWQNACWGLEFGSPAPTDKLSEVVVNICNPSVGWGPGSRQDDPYGLVAS